MQVKSHFTLLVYPFRHAVSGKERIKRLQKLEGRWLHWWQRLDSEEIKSTLDDSYFFLPYIRVLLFPETALLRKADAPEQVAEARRLSALRLGELAKNLHPDGVLRLTYDPEQLKALHPLRMELKRNNFEAVVRLCWVDVALFPQNVGLLIMKVQLDEKEITVRRLNDFLYYLRLVLPPTLDWELVNWQRITEGAPLIFKIRDLIDFLLQGLTEGSERIDSTLDAFVHHLRQGSSIERYSATEMGQVYGQAFRQYTYVCLDESSNSSNPNSATRALEQTLFASPIQQAIYELATCTDTSDPNYVPHPDGLAKLMSKGHIAFWENWEGMALHDNVVFLGKRPSAFLLNAFAHNVESDYFHLYLLTLYQKMRLSLLAGELLRQAKDLHRNLKEARALWDAFTMFRNHYWFAEVSFKPQGNEIYRRFQSGLEILPLYEAISDEAKELKEYYEQKSERHISILLNFLTFVGLPASLIVNLFSSALLKEASWLQFGITAGVVHAIAGIAWWLWNRLGKD